ncbi:E3 ubiquitin ligase TRAF3IP2-like isoform X2 [Phycodurus eques]|uniref:E3 ubiquitin ligase TRAF3IP2-like isoform X2 n=1 Tax=Phycodurus eques TaxID=693459 RepID=UPI002ACEC69D|nr:E3 ubiquitin ligase TRAF3IP2-like isoform X2 [Phycodurus eques]
MSSSHRTEDGHGWEEEAEQLEPPLPLKSDEDDGGAWPFLPLAHHYVHRTHDFHPEMCHDLSRHCALCCHQRRSPGPPSQNWLRSQVSPSVSVNVPHFFVPPEELVSRVSGVTTTTAAVSSAAVSSAASHPHQRRRSLPKESRNIFITYSSDSSCEMIGLVDFLSKHGFQPAMDTVDRPRTNVDIITWEHAFIKDPSTPIIVAISPRYKADIEGCAVHTRGLHTKYIYSMMQHEFIQQGSLNFRFIPVLFLDASQEDVPAWLQNTRVYRWPRDTNDLLLRLLREERFVLPPVPVELTLIITPVATTS